MTTLQDHFGTYYRPVRLQGSITYDIEINLAAMAGDHLNDDDFWRLLAKKNLARKVAILNNSKLNELGELRLDWISASWGDKPKEYIQLSFFDEGSS